MRRFLPALLFALAAVGAAALHVLLETPGAVREWRQTLPLAAVLGAALGLWLRPRGALAGIGAGVIGMGLFAVAFGAGHGLIEAVAGAADPLRQAADAAGRVYAAAYGPTGAGLLALCAVAGWLAGRGGPSWR